MKERHFLCVILEQGTKERRMQEERMKECLTVAFADPGMKELRMIHAL